MHCTVKVGLLPFFNLFCAIFSPQFANVDSYCYIWNFKSYASIHRRSNKRNMHPYIYISKLTTRNTKEWKTWKRKHFHFEQDPFVHIHTHIHVAFPFCTIVNVTTGVRKTLPMLLLGPLVFLKGRKLSFLRFRSNIWFKR